MPSTVLRPNSDLGWRDDRFGTASGTLVVVGAATMNQALATTADTTFIDFNPNSLNYANVVQDAPQLQVGFPAFTTPAGYIVKYLVLRIRAASLTTGQGAVIKVAFAANTPGSNQNGYLVGMDQYQPPPPIQTSPWPLSLGAQSYASAPIYQSPTNSAGYYTGGYWTAADLAKLDVSISYKSPGVDPGIRVYELYLDVIYSGPPSVVVTGPTGTKTVSNPTSAWTYTQGSDGSAQTGYQVRVFTLAQYSAGGFDPATSVSTWDSGIMTGSNTTQAITTLLANGTFRAYVRVAQVTSGVTQWSAWAFSQFIVNVAGPGAPTVTAVAIQSLGRIDVTVTKGANPVWSAAQVQRSLDGGATWADLRDYTLHDVTGLTTVTIADYEVPPDTLVTYQARGLLIAAGGTIAGNWSSPSAATLFTITSNQLNCDGTVAWLKNPVAPARNMLVRLGAGSLTSKTRRVSRGLFDILGRQNPIAVTDQRRSVETELIIITLTVAEEQAVLALFASATTLLLQCPAIFGWASAYISPGDLVESQILPNIARPERLFNVPITVTDAPAGISLAPPAPAAPPPATNLSAFAQTAFGVGSAWRANNLGIPATTAFGVGSAKQASTSQVSGTIVTARGTFVGAPVTATSLAVTSTPWLPASSSVLVAMVNGRVNVGPFAAVITDNFGDTGGTAWTERVNNSFNGADWTAIWTRKIGTGAISGTVTCDSSADTTNSGRSIVMGLIEVFGATSAVPTQTGNAGNATATATVTLGSAPLASGVVVGVALESNTVTVGTAPAMTVTSTAPTNGNDVTWMGYKVGGVGTTMTWTGSGSCNGVQACAVEIPRGAGSAGTGNAVTAFGVGSAKNASVPSGGGVPGFPDTTNTGIPAGTVLTNTGGFTASTANATYNNLNVTGYSQVTTTGVTFNKCRFTGPNWYVHEVQGGASATYNDCEFNGTLLGASVYSNGAQAAPDCFHNLGTATLNRCYLHNGVSVFQLGGGSGNSTLTDCLVQDLLGRNDSGRMMTDGSVVSGSTTITSTQAAFSAADLGSNAIVIWDDPPTTALDNNNSIVSVSGNTAQLAKPARATVSGLKFWIGPISGSSHNECIKGTGGSPVTNVQHCTLRANWGSLGARGGGQTGAFHYSTTGGSITVNNSLLTLENGSGSYVEYIQDGASGVMTNNKFRHFDDFGVDDNTHPYGHATTGTITWTNNTWFIGGGTIAGP